MNNEKTFLFKTKNYKYFIAKNDVWKLFTFFIGSFLIPSLIYPYEKNFILSVALFILIIFVGGISFIQRVPKFAFDFIPIQCKKN